VDWTPEEAAMGITREIPAGEPFELVGRIVGLERETGPGGQHRPLREA
jgi:hypothetical protein